MPDTNITIEQAMIELRLISQRLVRIETRQAKHMAAMGLNPSRDSGQPDTRPAVPDPDGRIEPDFNSRS